MSDFQYDGELPADIAKQLQRKSKSQIDPDLSYALDFNEDDLRANREGKMTARQANLLKGLMWKFDGLWKYYTFMLFICFVIGILWLPNEVNRYPENQRPIAVLMFIILPGLVTMLGVGKIMYGLANAGQDINNSVVLARGGKVILERKSGISFVTIGYQSYKLEHKAYLRFKHLDRYTIYYAPISKIILSAEPMVE
jgi:hypothetical protein